jgi:archaellum component FlaC
MANGVKSIYSRRQRMAPGQYETPLADFLDRLPDYVGQYQAQKLALDKQKLQERRYNDALLRQKEIDDESRKQKEYTNELNLLKSLPKEAQANAFATSKISRIRDVGVDLQKKEQAFTDRINSVYTKNPNDPYAITISLEGMLSEQSIIDNPSYTQKIKDRIDAEKPRVARQEIDSWAKENPNNPRINEIMSLSRLDPVKAVGLIVPERTSVSTSQKQVYNPSTGAYAYATDSEIAMAKATETKEDDLIPISGAPKQGGGSTRSLAQINKAIKDVSDALSERKRKANMLSPLTPEQKARLQKRKEAFESQRETMIMGSPIDIETGDDLTIPNW